MTPRGIDAAMSIDEIVAICRQIGFEIEVGANSVRVLGYRRLRHADSGNPI